MDAERSPGVLLVMRTLRTHSLLILLLLSFPTVSGSQEGALVTFDYPRESDHLLLSAQRTRSFRPDTGLATRVETWRVFGDGRVELEPGPDWLPDEEIVLPPEALEHLLHSLDVLVDLGDQHLTPFDTTADSFVEVHLDRYVSASHAIQFLEARVVSDLQPVFEELATLRTWLIRRAAQQSGRVIWVSGNPWPRSCQEEHRRKLGHRVLRPAWCSPPAFDDSVIGPFDGSEEQREAVRERLRERLRNLPRGLPDSDSFP